MANIYAAVDWAVDVANNPAHGYDQEHRNGPDYDCSSFVATALNKGGFDVSPLSWTGNLYDQLLGNGFTVVPLDAPRQLGDVFLNVRHHVVMCVNENQLVQASINEQGGITGGKTGDQTGTEIYVCPFYWYSHGWDYHLRPPVSSYKNEEKKTYELVIDIVLGS